MRRLRIFRRFFVLSAAVVLVLLGGAAGALLGVCGPFTDVTDAGFCPFVLEIFTLGITTGTTPTTYDPGSSVTRLQMAAFLSRSVDRVLQRGSRRALAKKFWTPQSPRALGVTSLGGSSVPNYITTDGRDVWVNDVGIDAVLRVRASDGRLLETWTGVTGGRGIVVAAGGIFVAGNTSPGRLYRINPALPAGAPATVANTLGAGSQGLAFDGGRFWASSLDGSVSIVTPGPTVPWSTTTVTTGFSSPYGLVYDGSGMWLGDSFEKLYRLDPNGAILQTITLAGSPGRMAFDGVNLWVPFGFDAVALVRASSGVLLATLTGNGLDFPSTAAFDGERVLIVNNTGSVSLWKAADLTALGTLSTGAGTQALGSASDGLNFWITLPVPGRLVRF